MTTSGKTEGLGWVDLGQPRQAEVGHPVAFDVVASLPVPVDFCVLPAALAQVALMPAFKLEGARRIFRKCDTRGLSVGARR